jgi:hypothetical protein
MVLAAGNKDQPAASTQLTWQAKPKDWGDEWVKDMVP